MDLKKLMRFSGILGILWDFKIFYGILWDSKGFKRIERDIK